MIFYAMAKVSSNLLKHGLIPFLEKRKADAHTIHQLLHIREIAEEEVFLRTTLGTRILLRALHCLRDEDL